MTQEIGITIGQKEITNFTVLGASFLPVGYFTRCETTSREVILLDSDLSLISCELQPGPVIAGFWVPTSQRARGRESLINLDGVVKREVFWSRTQSLSYFVDRVPLSLAPNDCRKKPRDLKARSRRHPLQKQMTL